MPLRGIVAWHTLSRWIDDLENKGELMRISEPVDVELEAGAIADKLVKSNGKAVIFEKPRLPNGEISPIPLACLLYTSPSPRDQRGSRMPSSA